MSRRKPIDIPANIQRLIDARGLSVYAAARLCDISQPQLRAILLGEHEAKLSTLRKVAAGFGKSLVLGTPAGNLFV
ncbi:hypothetical protein LCGC14_0727990 [marine sediment metagenome]|uniref:HTH cro/C1-type domain-containing protein n=1 Tax=marine sediment metagenome TaxID=412755 RepID=A0A0F9QVF5_9ZZZZ